MPGKSLQITLSCRIGTWLFLLPRFFAFKSLLNLLWSSSTLDRAMAGETTLSRMPKSLPRKGRLPSISCLTSISSKEDGARRKIVFNPWAALQGNTIPPSLPSMSIPYQSDSGPLQDVTIGQSQAVPETDKGQDSQFLPRFAGKKARINNTIVSIRCVILKGVSDVSVTETINMFSQVFNSLGKKGSQCHVAPRSRPK